MATAEWNQLHDRFYRKTEIYEMLWEDIELDKYIVAGAPFGGPIAMVRDERKVLMLKKEVQSALPMMRIFTSAGKPLSSFTWNYRGLVQIGWTEEEDLVCVLNDGKVHMYTLHGDRIKSFDLGFACQQDGIAECHMWGSGLVVRTAGKSELYAITSFVNPDPFKLADIDDEQHQYFNRRPPTCMAVIPPQFNVSGSPEVLLGTDSGSIVVVDAKEAQDQLLENGPFSKMVVSPTGGVVACFNDEGTLFVMSTDFTKNLSRFGTSSKIPPRDIVWCGEDSVILYWDKILLMVGPHGDFVKYGYESPLFLITECDGVRIISDEQCEFLQRVPDPTESIFKIGATSSPALLYDAAEAFEEKSVKADENIRTIDDRKDLKDAIDSCLAAASHEFDHTMQKKLLEAASFGKLYCDNYRTDNFVDSCRVLRVLNAVRHYSVGIPLTFGQYQKLEAEVLVDRLVNRHNHLLALRVCQYLRMPTDGVLTHWACAKIQADDELDDPELGQLIIDKLSVCPGISFKKVATVAYHAGRRTLAIMLLDCEPHASNQVPLLISMKQDELALDKAIESGDTDLVYLCILHIKEHRPFRDFFNTIVNKPMARNLYISYCKKLDLSSLKTFYYHMQKPVEAANIAVLEAYQSSDWKERMDGLEIALEFYRKDKNNTFAAKTTAEQIQLLNHQCKWELELEDPSFVDTSVSQLIGHYIKHGQVRKAMKVQQEYKVPEKRLWHIEVRILAKCQAWNELAKLTANKKQPPIGFHPFIEACVEQNAYVEAAKYINRLTDPHEKMEWLCNIDYWQDAAEVAASVRDIDALQLIRARCRNPAVVAHIDRIMKSNGWI